MWLVAIQAGEAGMKKGVTPIIAIILLLLITVALAGAAWSFMQNLIFPTIQEHFSIPPGGSYCVKGASNSIRIYATNTGYQSDLVPADFTIAEVDGSDAAAGLVTSFTIKPGDSDKIFDWSCGAGCSTGYHSVDLGTTSVVYHLSIFCP